MVRPLASIQVLHLRRPSELGEVLAMHLLDRLNRAQRIIVVVALGLALGTVGSYINGLGSKEPVGWLAYNPSDFQIGTPAIFGGTGLPAWLRLIVWLALIGIWALASIRVLRPPRDKNPPG
jgi:hypothetical protein